MFRIKLQTLVLLIAATVSSQSHAVDHEIKVTVRNLFRKFMTQVRTADKMPHAVKVCLANNKAACTEEMVLGFDQSHTFIINKYPQLSSAIQNGHLLPKSLIVYVSGVPCSHIYEYNTSLAELPEQSYPSDEIPYGMESPADAQTMEIDVLRVLTGWSLKWSRGGCRIRYRDETGEYLGRISYPDGFCQAVNQGKPAPSYSVLPFTGYGAPRYLARGLFDNELEFTARIVKVDNKQVDPKGFCAALEIAKLDREIGELKTSLNRNVEGIVRMAHLIGRQKGVPASGVADKLLQMTSYWDLPLRDKFAEYLKKQQNHLSSLEYFDLLENQERDRKEQVSILKTAVSQSESVLTEVKNELDAVEQLDKKIVELKSALNGNIKNIVENAYKIGRINDAHPSVVKRDLILFTYYWDLPLRNQFADYIERQQNHLAHLDDFSFPANEGLTKEEQIAVLRSAISLSEGTLIQLQKQLNTMQLQAN